jgi:para-aminobenzoate synthetase/4-amino-4-deoxychorismate lyase
MSYECAGGINPALSTARPGAFPLAWGAVYDRPVHPSPLSGGKFSHSSWRPSLSQKHYFQAVRRIQSLIGRGDTYQVNYTFPLQARWTGDAVAWYRELAAAQGAPYSAYVDMGRWKILSLSPELFFEKQGNRLRVRPMKGSAPRGRWDSEDRAFAKTLRSSAKERAENVMIVDLLRNDLGKIARAGSVRTTNLCQTEPYPTLWQMTSEIEAQLRPGAGLAAMMEALFPSGSVTGAPKRRTMEIIRDLESGPRGLYTGTLGLLRPDDRWTFSVGIRTLTLDEKTGDARCPVGSGITAASRPADEYRECLLKSDFLKTPSFDLVESFRCKDGKGFLMNAHLARLRRSAKRLGFVWNEARLRADMEKELARHRTGVWKIRLRMARDGRVRCEAEPIHLPLKKWRIALAKTPVDERDIFLYHKTTRRDVYDHHRLSYPGMDDVILWNRRGEITESTVANVVVEMKGKRYTPPVSSGLLGGVFRQTLLRRGRVRERALTRQDLRRADGVFLVNSVRGWIPVESRVW